MKTKRLVLGDITAILFIFVTNDLEGQGQMSPYAIPSENFPRYTYKPNLVILGTFFQKLLSGQAHFGPILTVFGPNDLEGQGQMSPYAIPSENFPRYTYKPNLVILGTFFQKLLSGQAIVDRRTDRRTDGQTDRRTDAGDDNTPRPYWPRGKNCWIVLKFDKWMPVKFQKDPTILNPNHGTSRLCEIWRKDGFYYIETEPDVRFQ